MIAQFLIFLGYLIFFYSRFKKEKYNILLFDNISRLCTILGYIIFGSINSIEHTVYGIVRNSVGRKLIDKKAKYKLIGFLIMLTILLIMYSLSYNGFSTLMFILSAIVNLVAIIFGNEQHIRLGTIIAAILNISAFIIIGSYASIIGESLCLIVSIISIFKNKQKKV